MQKLSCPIIEPLLLVFQCQGAVYQSLKSWLISKMSSVVKIRRFISHIKSPQDTISDQNQIQNFLQTEKTRRPAPHSISKHTQKYKTLCTCNFSPSRLEINEMNKRKKKITGHDRAKRKKRAYNYNTKHIASDANSNPHSRL